MLKTENLEKNKDPNSEGFPGIEDVDGKKVKLWKMPTFTIPGEKKDMPPYKEIRVIDDDGWPFRKLKNQDYGSTSKNPVSIDVNIHSENYNMQHKRRGVALIFNHINFSNMGTRKGSDKDCSDLARTLKNLDFEVRIYRDPSLITISSILRNTAAEDHTDADCLIVTVMSHGESTLLYSSDSLYPVDLLWTEFTADNCATLAGKPKLFFIQACRGNKFDDGVIAVESFDVTDSRTSSYTIPAYSDIMVAYSTLDGFYSWRNPDDGSWFIQAICKEFNINGRTRDLLTLMTFVCRRVAINYQSFVPHRSDFNEKKQIPSIVSMLTRLVYFPKKAESTSIIPNNQVSNIYQNNQPFAHE